MTTNGIRYFEKKHGNLSFSSTLFTLRKTEEHTQQEIADAIGESKSRICDFEKGRRIPTLNQAGKLADFFGFPKSFFYKMVFEDQARNAGIDLQVEISA